MIRPLPIVCLLFAVLAGGCAVSTPQSQPRLLHRADVVPLAIDPAFSFRKTSLFVHDRKEEKQTTNAMVSFERERLGYGAIMGNEITASEGHYFHFWWRAQRPAHLTVRLEYRQENLGAYVQAQEVDVPAAKGTVETSFKVVGDAYHQDGRVTAWRALLIENGKVVALTQSFLWN
ncbi:MAG: hypothetical protein PHQ12_07725 [Chthoniobacteraceae bacterium]|nr:hypothetical protein [Chthoniobacteraceae bacterium]